MKNLFTQLFIILTLFTQVLFAEDAVESDEESTISENTSTNDEESSTEDETYIEEFVEDFEDKKIISRKKYMIYKDNNFNLNHKKYNE